MSFDLQRGSGPLVLSVPHAGTEVPPDLAERMTPQGRALPDTDWRVDELYDFVEELGASRIVARTSRYVVDLNRDPAGDSLYPGRATTELVPTTTFDGTPLYRPGAIPDAEEIESRRRRWFDPYHAALSDLLDETIERHGFALLWDAHSIVSRSPRLFDGLLPELNLGTNSGRSAAPEVREAVVARLTGASGWTTVVDGRFRGGWITRRYGRPERGVHALQMELAQRSYMTEPGPGPVDSARAARLRPLLRSLIEAALGAARPPSSTAVQGARSG